MFPDSFLQEKLLPCGEVVSIIIHIAGVYVSLSACKPICFHSLYCASQLVVLVLDLRNDYNTHPHIVWRGSICLIY